MPVQYRIDDIIDNNDGTVTFQIGPYGFTRDKFWFFDRSTFNQDHMIKNMRLAHKIGTKADLASREFLNSVNGGQKGMDLGADTWFIRSIVLAPGSTNEYDVSFSASRNGPVSHTVRIDRQDIEQETSGNPEDIFDNVKSFMRLSNFNDFTVGVITAIKSRLFWA